uniref:TIL domain-containing protein n=1 Tax=Anopheles funestus TaxID=62324 RepID=A0A182RDI6_ANOFN
MKCTEIFFVITILTFALAGVCSARDECGVNEYYSDCGPMYELNCLKKNLAIDTYECIAGCFCKTGYIREVQGGMCIPAANCP